MKKALMYLVLLLVSLSFVSSEDYFSTIEYKVLTPTQAFFQNPFSLVLSKVDLKPGESVLIGNDLVSSKACSETTTLINQIYKPDGTLAGYIPIKYLNSIASDATMQGTVSYVIPSQLSSSYYGQWKVVNHIRCGIGTTYIERASDTKYFLVSAGTTCTPRTGERYCADIKQVAQSTTICYGTNPVQDIRIVETCSGSCQNGACVSATPPPDNSYCSSNWQCSDWSNCVGGKQIRNCADSKGCNILATRPAIEQACGDGSNIPVPVLPNIAGFPFLQASILAILLFIILAIVFMRKK